MTRCTLRRRWRCLAAAGLVLAASAATAQEWKSGIEWPVPAVVDPGPAGPPAPVPSDAIVLFDGTDLDAWHGGDRWKIEDGVATVAETSITTKESFGDYQLHIEWASPAEVRGHGQGRGNSGVFLANRYEVQILDSYENETYPDGQCGAVYKQRPPLVNASRPPGEWQTFDIVFRAPRFDDDGELVTPAYVTVFHNGVLIQNHFEIQGTTYWHRPPSYEPHPLRQPIMLQDHGDPVRFRNIWIREL